MLRQVLASSGYKQDSLIQLPNGQCIRLGQPKSSPQVVTTSNVRAHTPSQQKAVTRVTQPAHNAPRQTLAKTHVTSGQGRLLGGRKTIQPKTPTVANLGSNLHPFLQTSQLNHTQQVKHTPTSLFKDQTLPQVTQTASNLLTINRNVQSPGQAQHSEKNTTEDLIGQHSIDTTVQFSKNIETSTNSTLGTLGLHDHIVPPDISNNSAGDAGEFKTQHDASALGGGDREIQHVETSESLTKPPVVSPEIEPTQAAAIELPNVGSQAEPISDKILQDIPKSVNSNEFWAKPEGFPIPPSPATETQPTRPEPIEKVTPRPVASTPEELATSQENSNQSCSIQPAASSPAPEVTPEVERETGKDYIIEYSNGKKYLATWTGQYFSVKSMMSETGKDLFLATCVLDPLSPLAVKLFN